jgi:hypothetical protein
MTTFTTIFVTAAPLYAQLSGAKWSGGGGLQYSGLA